MRFDLERVLGHGIAGMILALCTQTSLLAQQKVAVTQPSRAFVPFIGCKSDGQAGPQEAPTGTRVAVPMSPKTAQTVTYYSAFGQGTGVLAPRGWYCFGLYGSSGSVLFVGPQPTDTANLHSSGPAIVISHTSGDGSGRFEVAEMIARVFPAHNDFAAAVEEEIAPERSFTFGPYPKDVLLYKSKELVEYKTPAQSEGLGTHLLKKNGSAIEGWRCSSGKDWI